MIHAQTARLNQTDALRRFLDAPAPGAAVLRVCVRGVTPEVLFMLDCEKLVTEAKNGAVAEHIVGASYDWTETAGCETSFSAIWQNGRDDVLATHQWRCAPRFENAQQFNGSPESYIKEMQLHLHTVMRVHLEGLEVSKNLFTTAMQMATKRIETLERKLEEQETTVDAARKSEGANVEAAMELERFDKLLTWGEKLVNALGAKPALPASAGASSTGAASTGAASTAAAAVSGTAAGNGAAS